MKALPTSFDKSSFFIAVKTMGFTAIAAVIAGAMIVLYGLLGSVVFLALIVIIAAALWPREATYVVVTFGLLQFLFTKAYPILPLWCSGLDEVLLVGLLGRTLFDLCDRPHSKFKAPAVLAAYFIWSICGLLTGVARGQSIVTMALAFRGINLPLTLLLAAGLYFKETRDRERLRWIIISVGVFHAALSILQWAADPYKFDVGFGVLGPGGANAAGFLDLIVLLLILSRPIRKWSLVIVALLIFAPIASSARAAIYIIPFSVLTLYIARGAGLKDVMRAVAVLSVLGVALWSYMTFRGGGEEFAVRQLIEAQFNAGQSGRFLYILALPRVLGSNILLWLFGLGPGAYTSGVGVATFASAFRSAAYIKDSATGGFAYAYPDIQWACLLGEYGMIGTIAVLVLLLAPQLRWWEQHREIAERGDITVILPAIGVMLIAAMTTLNIMEFQPLAYTCWTVAGLIYSFTTVDATGGVAREIKL